MRMGLMGFVGLGLLCLAGCDVLQGATEAGAPVTTSANATHGNEVPEGTAPALAGVWAVSMRIVDGSCPDMKAGSRAATWTVNQGDDGKYDVAPVGPDEPLPLTGSADGGRLTLTGHGGLQERTIQWRIAGSGASLTGTAIETREASRAFPAPISRWNPDGTQMRDGWCALIWEADLTRTTAGP